MELRHVRYFVAVAETLSFTRGAERLRIAQPSLTRQIKDLEDELGVRLFDRSKKQIKLTRAGEIFLAGAKRLVDLSAELVESIRVLKDEASTAINIGYVPNPFQRVLPLSLVAFERQFPNIAINLFGLSSTDQMQSLHDGKIDIGFVGTVDTEDYADMRFQVIATSHGMALLPPNHALAKKNAVNLKDLESSFFIALSEGCFPGYARWLNQSCKKAGFNPRVIQLADNESILLQAVRSELGVAVLPDQVRKVPHERVVIRPITPAVVLRSSVAWKKDNPSPTLEAYLRTLQQVGQTK
jgi:DNA-binding transcriptional LysR family regulator